LNGVNIVRMEQYDDPYYEPLRRTVMAAEDGWKLRTFLQTRMLVSRQLIVRLKLLERGILLNGVRQYMDFLVREGDVIEVRMPQEQSDDILPQPMALDIVHEDGQVLVINKPPGLIVHPTHGHYINTLANGVVHYWQEKGVRHRFRPVQRLDQETSGLLLIAKTPYAHQYISLQLIEHTVKKEYLAIVRGQVQQESGTVDAPIDRLPDEPHRRAVLEGGAPALTHYEVLERFATCSLLRLRLMSGRTHQIRVHMEHIGHPLLGDALYGLPRKAVATEVAQTEVAQTEDVERQRVGEPTLDRHALHATTLGFLHPADGQWCEFHCPLPADLQEYLKELTS
jgi:23S rRNA pseudouridine1911/1915/1917 synthase